MNSHENMLKIAAKSEISVLLQGESGSGKEVAARFIHSHSPRCNSSFVPLNCGAISPNLAESILEGSKKGAFTGASTDQQGIVRAADGGTLFLDEIGEMPLSLQCKLLRILQERTILPLGTTQGIPVDFRLICATNRDLKKEVAAGRFREDLYFRLSAFPVTIPPLRNRTDFDEITNSIWQELANAAPLSCAEIQLLQSEQWPGNIRQLRNVLQRYAILMPHGFSLQQIMEEEYPPHAHDCSTGRNPRGCTLRETTRRYNSAPSWDAIYAELNHTQWNRCATARNLGISRGCLNYQIKIHKNET